MIDYMRRYKILFGLVGLLIIGLVVASIMVSNHRKQSNDSSLDNMFAGFRPGSDTTHILSTDCNDPKLKNDIKALGFTTPVTYEKCRIVKRDSYFNEDKFFKEYALEVSAKDLTSFLNKHKHENKDVTAYTYPFDGSASGMNLFTIDNFLDEQIQKFGKEDTTKSLFKDTLPGKSVFITYPTNLTSNGDVPVVVRIINGVGKLENYKVTILK